MDLDKSSVADTISSKFCFIKIYANIVAVLFAESRCESQLNTHTNQSRA